MSRRRFRIGIHSQYDKRFDARKRASQILNPMGNQVSWLVFEMGDEDSLTTLLQEWKAKLKRAEEAVAACDREFEELKATRAKAGRVIPSERDRRAYVEYIDLLAADDVTGEEVDKLESLLGKFRDQRLAAEAANVLRCGPIGTGKIGAGNVLCVLDGQMVRMNEDGVLAITDRRSPYDGMAVQDYRTHLVKPWLAAHKRRCAVDRASLPPWPDAVPRKEAVTR